MVKNLILDFFLRARFYEDLFPPKKFRGFYNSTRCYTLLPAIIVWNLKEN